MRIFGFDIYFFPEPLSPPTDFETHCSLRITRETVQYGPVIIRPEEIPNEGICTGRTNQKDMCLFPGDLTINCRLRRTQDFCDQPFARRIIA